MIKSAARLLSRVLPWLDKDDHAGLVWISIWPTSSSITALPHETFAQCLDQIVVPKLTRQKHVIGVWKLHNNSPAARGGSPATNNRPVHGGPYVLAVRVDDLSHMSTDGGMDWLTLPELEQKPANAMVDHDAELADCAVTKTSSLFGVELRTFRVVQRFAKKHRTKDRGRCIVAVAIEPAPGQEKEIDRWYRDEHLQQIAQNPMHIRSTRYELASSAPGGDRNTRPRLLALHEFTGVQEMLNYAINSGQIVPETEWSKRIFANAVSVERTVWDVRGKHSTPGQAMDWL